MIEQQYLEQLETAIRDYYEKYPDLSTDLEDSMAIYFKSQYDQAFPPISIPRNEWVLTEKEWKRMYDSFPAFQTGEGMFFNPIGYMMYRKKVPDDVAQKRKQIEEIIKKVKQ